LIVKITNNKTEKNNELKENIYGRYITFNRINEQFTYNDKNKKNITEHKK